MSKDLPAKLTKIKAKASAAINKAESVSALDKVESKYLGRKSELTTVLRGLGKAAQKDRAVVGKLANQTQAELTKQLKEKRRKLRAAELNQRLRNEFLDVTTPGQPLPVGKLNPITVERHRVEEIFQRMGFEIVEPYLVDDDYHNFTSVNIPEGHPARDMWDTIRVDSNHALIPHTSSMQNRIISGSEPPIRAIVPGKCFRNEATDARHEHSFFQVEGVYVDHNIKLSDMLGTLAEFLKHYFDREVPIKIQPTFFPFVEPGLEIMMECPVCRGKKTAGCTGCGSSGWMEVIPCGPIHPFVIKEAGLDPESYSGFAWGFGLDRMVMIKHQINDIRYFHSGNLDFINQF